MTEQYKKEERFLRIVANAYISHCADELLKNVPEDFGFDTMWRFQRKIENKKQYEEYITNKLAIMRARLITTEFAMMKDKRDGKPLLLITNSKNPDGGQAVIVATSDDEGNIKRLDITAAEFYPLEPMSVNNEIKRTYETLLAREIKCDVIFTTRDKQDCAYKGVFLVDAPGGRWGLAHLDDIPDNFCAVYDHRTRPNEARMITPDTRISVDFVFVNADNQIVKIHRNAEPLSREVISCDNVAYVIELKAGQCEKNDIDVGDVVQVNTK